MNDSRQEIGSIFTPLLKGLIKGNSFSWAITLKTDGSVATWGYSAYGADSSSASGSLSSGVTVVYSAFYAFVALKTDDKGRWR